MAKKILKGKIVAKGYTIKQVAELINVSPQTLYNWCNNNKIDMLIKVKKLCEILDIDIRKLPLENEQKESKDM